MPLSAFLPQGDSMFSIFLTGIAMLVAAWAIWFLAAFIRYILSGDYQVDKRLKDICR